MSGDTDNSNKESSGDTVWNNHMLNNWGLFGISHAKDTEFERVNLDINSG